jgi:hypothetical protein
MLIVAMLHARPGHVIDATLIDAMLHARAAVVIAMPKCLARILCFYASTHPAYLLGAYHAYTLYSLGQGVASRKNR